MVVMGRALRIALDGALLFASAVTEGDHRTLEGGAVILFF